MTPTTKQIEMIEDLPLSASDRWYVLLALTGQKKASWLMMVSDVWRDGNEPIKVPEDSLRRVGEVFKELGIAYGLRFRDSIAGLYQPDEPSEFRQRYNQICDIFIGISQGDVDELVSGVEVMDHKRIGRALDYPATAVDAFGTDSSHLVKRLPEHPALECEPYVWFALSEDHYQEELAVVQSWYDTVKTHSEIIKLELRKDT